MLKKHETIDEIEGYIRDEKRPEIFHQDFQPCIHRKLNKCNTCPSGKALEVHSCEFKNIRKLLNCVGCAERTSP